MKTKSKPQSAGQLVRMPVSELVQNENNPRKITDKRKAQLRKSLEQFGNLSPITWNRTTKRVTAAWRAFAARRAIPKLDRFNQFDLREKGEPTEGDEVGA